MSRGRDYVEESLSHIRASRDRRERFHIDSGYFLTTEYREGARALRERNRLIVNYLTLVGDMNDDGKVINNDVG